ncbi:hypothetical protein FDZ74_12290 [bacterium]|nr:MAG: hypothetical protein FDZ74_12290 [bacterium]
MLDLRWAGLLAREVVRTLLRCGVLRFSDARVVLRAGVLAFVVLREGAGLEERRGVFAKNQSLKERLF